MSDKATVRRLYRRRMGLDKFYAVLGDATGVVEEPGQPYMVRVRYTSANTFGLPTVVRFRASMKKDPGTPVLIEYDDEDALAVTGGYFSGQVAAGVNPAGDNAADDRLKYVTPDMLSLLHSHVVSTTADSMLVTVFDFVYIKDLVLHWFLGGDGTQTPIDLTSYIPTDPATQCLACLFVDTATDLIEIVTSTPIEMGGGNYPTFDDVQECITASPEDSIPVWAWRLYYGQTGVRPGPLETGGDDFLDLRQFINIPGSGAGGMTSFTLAADTGTPATIGDGDTATIAGGTAIATSVAGQTVTISVVTEALQDMIAAFLLEGANIDLTYDDTGNTLTIAVTGLDSGDISDFSEAVDDRVNALLVEGTGIDLTYNDGANTLTIAVSSITASQVSDFAEAVDDRIAALMVAGTGISLTYDDTANTFTVAVSGLTAANISGFNESVDDRVAALTVAGTGISLTYDDTANTLTVAVSGLTASNIGGFDESVDDRVASLLVAGSGISITYNDGANTLTIASTVTPVTSVTATAPLASSGGTTPNISVDNAVVALRQHVVAASTANVTKSSAPATLDGVTLVSGDRILLKNQTTGSENGLWIFNGSGSALTRTTDYAAGSTTNAFAGVAVMVLGGTTNKGAVYYITTTGTITIDTTSTSWSAYNFAGGQVAGNLDVSTMRDVLNNLVVEVVDVSSDYTTNSTSFADIDATHLQVTKVTGSTALVGFAGSVVASGAANINFNIKVNGVDYFANDGFIAINPGSNETNASFVVPITGLTPGSNQFRLRWKVSTGSVTATMRAGAGASGGRDIHPNLWVQ